MNNIPEEARRAEPAISAIPTINIRSDNRRTRSTRIPIGRSSRLQVPRPRRGPGLIIFQRQRQHFITRVYLLATAFIALTLIQWISIITNPNFSDFFKEKYYISLIAGLTAILLITFFAIFGEIRYIEPYNWIFAYLIVELETFALLRSPLNCNLSQLAICFLATIVLNGVFTFIGIIFPRDLTQDIMIFIVVSLTFYFAASIIIILLIATELYFLKVLLIVGTIFFLLVYIIYVSQLIMGDRTGSLRWNDFILAALLVYFNFMLILSSTLNLTSELFY